MTFVSTGALLFSPRLLVVVFTQWRLSFFNSGVKCVTQCEMPAADALRLVADCYSG